jgi:hypothetical protein
MSDNCEKLQAADIVVTNVCWPESGLLLWNMFCSVCTITTHLILIIDFIYDNNGMSVA